MAQNGNGHIDLQTLLPPYSHEAEEAFIGAFMLNTTVVAEYAAFLKPTDFYILRNQYIWQAVLRLHKRGEAVDYMTLCEELRSIGKLEEVGGGAYLTLCVAKVPTSMHAWHYGRLVHRLAVRRDIMQAARKITELAMDEVLALNDIVLKMRETYESAVRRFEETQTESDLLPASKISAELLAQIETQTPRVTQPLGLTSLDRLLEGGIEGGELMIVAGIPGMGKSALTAQFAHEVAAMRKTVLVVTTETDPAATLRRMAAYATGVPHDIIRNPQRLAGYPQSTELLKQFMRLASGWRLAFYHHSNPSASEIRLQVERLLAEGDGIGLVIVDGVYKMRSEYHPDDKLKAVEDNVRGLKNMAVDYRIPVVATHQFNADGYQGMPTLRNLHWGNSIVQEADIILLLSTHDGRPRETQDEQARVRGGDYDLLGNVAKYRNGSGALLPLWFRPRFMHFRDKGGPCIHYLRPDERARAEQRIAGPDTPPTVGGSTPPLPSETVEQEPAS